ncbi:DUF4178 domain-containing protein [Pseudonocardia parietis]|uniref:DUF4178 domain-containing protein n=1 Tax=Pseudonocardia parietis TaxID=570936 RepID=A0ABS4VTD6_9PSEU|nr:DUF4178 domain-containing protein [Pseudonocardia parietis]MBP2367174.1 hypothetical protein [Pseudonocardia parietis]
MIEFLLGVLAVVAVVVVVVLILRSRSSAGTSAPRRTDPLANEPDLYDPHRIGVGDVITYAGVDHVVRGTIVLEEGGVQWREHLLDSSAGRPWLSVEDDEGELEMVLWTRREDAAGLVPDGDVVLDDRVHRQIERGRASFTAEGTTGTSATGSVDYADYATADGTGLLAFERWAATQSWEISTGRAISRGELVVLHSAPPE